MLEQLLHHIEKNNLIRSGEKVLLAVSGGVDSMVMAHLFRAAEIPFGIAHCNFKLRGNHSDEDEKFVRAYCQERNVPFHLQSFDTKQYAEGHGHSIQVAARDLRYNFFRQVALSDGYHAVATAHHQDDNIETILLNLVRGTGIDGLTGIPVQNDIFIRPLHFAKRSEIFDYAKQNNLIWREDASNAEVHYKRNLLRLHVIPLLRQINPQFEDTFVDTLERIRGAKSLAELSVASFTTVNVSIHGDATHIDLQALREYDHATVLLWTLIKHFGFNFQQCKQMLQHHQPGKMFFSTTHRLTIDRHSLIIERRVENGFEELIIDEIDAAVHSGRLTLHFEVHDAHDHQVLRERNVAQLDLSKIQFPLVWRTWKAGDAFRPLGMKNKKKVSDLLIDEKIAANEKEQVTVLESAGKIMWVVGVRISEEFKIDESTNRILLIRSQWTSGE